MENLNKNLKRGKVFLFLLTVHMRNLLCTCPGLQQKEKVGLMLLSRWQFGRLESEKNDGCNCVLPAPGDRSQEGRDGAACRSDSCFWSEPVRNRLDCHFLVEEEQQELKPADSEDIIQVVTFIGVTVNLSHPVGDLNTAYLSEPLSLLQSGMTQGPGEKLNAKHPSKNCQVEEQQPVASS